PVVDSMDLMKLLQVKNPKHIIIIGWQFDAHIHPIKQKAKENGYSGTVISTKQLCYRDYYKNNKYFPTDSCRSSILYLTKDDTMNKVLLNIKLKHSNCLCPDIKMVSDKLIL